MSACSICSSDRLEEMEDLGNLALAGEISWRHAAEEAGLSHHKGLQNHMDRHYVSPTARVEQEADEVLAQLIQDTLDELKVTMQMSPVELKPLYAVAIRNLAGLKDTKPSQQHLISALRTIHEITGMKMEQRLMLEFGKAHFGVSAGAPAPTALPAPAIELALHGSQIREAEVVE